MQVNVYTHPVLGASMSRLEDYRRRAVVGVRESNVRFE
jgi:hypothetical protein